MATPKKTSKTAKVEKKLETTSKELKEKAKKIGEEIEEAGEKLGEQIGEHVEKGIEKGKDSLSGVSKRWDSSSDVEKVTMILGIILLLRGIIKLRFLLPGAILIALGALLVSGIFNSMIEKIFNSDKENNKKK